MYFVFPFIFQKLIWIPTRLILSTFGNLKIKGLENLKNIERPVIFACNHSSEIDPFMVPSCLHFFSRFSPIFYTTRERSFYENHGWKKYMFGGIFINMWGGYAVLPGLRNYKKSLLDHLGIIKDGGNVCFFPEGGITHDGRLQKGKGGIAYLAETTGCPIVPVGISGVYNSTIKDFFSFRNNINVSFGQTITQKEFKEKIKRKDGVDIHSYKREAEYVMNKISELLI